MVASRNKHIAFLLLAWLLGAAASYLLTAFFSFPSTNFYHASLLSFFFTVLIAIPGCFLLQAFNAYLQKIEFIKFWPILLAIAVLMRFAYRVVEVSFSFPNLIQAVQFQLSPSWLGLFLISISLALVACWLIVFRTPLRMKDKLARFESLVKQHAPGFLLAALFFTIYFVLANVFNRQDFNNNNVFFAADTHQWMLRLAGEGGHLMEMRAIHPLAFLLLRPLVYGLAFIFASQAFSALVFLLALVGAASIFLAWLFIFRTTANANHAFLFAALLGISTTSLVFNSLAETYVFSAFLLILFFVLLQGGAKLPWLIGAGVATFGITISNVIQTALGMLVTGFKLKRFAIFAVAVVGISLLLSLINRQFFPDSGFFFDPADYGVESQHYQLGSTPEEWSARAAVVGTDMVMFSIVAPQPFLLETNRDVRGTFPKFNMMLGDRSADLVGLGQATGWMWLGVLLAGVATFVYSLRQNRLTTVNQFGLVFLGCLIFNYIFHFFYGFEPFLYASDWTYALVVFAALGLSSLADSKAIHIVLLILLALLSLNNLSFLHFLISGLSPYIPIL